MKSIDIVSKIVAREGEAKASPSKGIQSINLSDYLLKSVWDKVFEVRTDSQGTEYIFGKLPIVTQYGITMFSGEGVNVPSLASGLPFDGRTIWYNPDTNQIEVIGGTGGGSGEGVFNFWDLSGIPSWITNSKPKYTYSEIEGTPDLSGYATQSWVENKKYLTAITSAMVTSALGFTPYNSANFTKANIKSALGISDWALASSKPSYTTSEVSEGTNLYFTNARAINALTETLKAYVTLGGTQTITGEKNFTGGLKVNGSPIYYDTEKKYWKLEGDLLVTGGVTMYGSDSSFTPSTIMDALLYDDTTLGINSNGELYVKGGTSGGGLDITALQNYLTQNSYLNVTGGDNRYLKLSGGTISSPTFSPLYIVRESTSAATIGFSNSVGKLGNLGFNDTTGPKWFDNSYTEFPLLHSGNYSSYALPLSGGTITGDVVLNAAVYGGSYISWKNPDNNEGGYFYGTSFNASKNYVWTKSILKWNVDTGIMTFEYTPLVGNSTIWHSGNDGSGSGLDADLLDGKQGSWYQQNVIAFNRQDPVAYNQIDANVVTGGMLYNYGSYTYWKNAPDGMYYGQILTLKSSDMFLAGQLAWDINHASTTDTTRFLWWRATDEGDWIEAKWHQIAFTDSNVSSATKLQTPRTIWGQSFDGTGNIVGSIISNTIKSKYVVNYNVYYAGYEIFASDLADGDELGVYFGQSYNAKKMGYISYHRGADDNSSYLTMGLHSVDHVVNINTQANVGIGTTNPSYKLDVHGISRTSQLQLDDVNSSNSTPQSYWGIYAWNDRLSFTSRNASNAFASEPLCILYNTGNVGIGTTNPSAKLHVSGDILTTGSIRTNSHLTADGQIYVAGSVFYGSGSEGIYIHGTGINFHNSSNTWSSSLIALSKNSITLQQPTTISSTLSVASNLDVGGYIQLPSTSGNNKTSNYISAGGGYSSGSGKYGIKLVVCDQTDAQTGIGQDLFGNPYELSLATTRSGNSGMIAFGYHYVNSTTYTKVAHLDISGNFLVIGGVTMYSDQRKKTILNHVELSLKQIAEAPLIEHYYNGDDKKTTHVGSIAQYWASMNDWFCKLDSEGYYTMEIQNAALASAISVARELVKFENETDKRIRLLEEENKELRNEIERLKSA